jgi:uncharacterized protein
MIARAREPRIPSTRTAAMPRAQCVVLHDVAPATQTNCERLLAALADAGDFRVTLLAVPRYHGGGRDAAFERWLQGRVAAGDEVALHGWTHRDERAPYGPIDHIRRRWYTRSEGEFADLDADEAAARIRAGLDWLAELDIVPAGFVAPAWLMGPGAWHAVTAERFAYTCTLRHFYLLGAMPAAAAAAVPPPPAGLPTWTVQSQVFSHSKAWRRAMSLAWNRSLAWRQRDAPVVRLELHPPDVAWPALKACWLRMATEQAETRPSMTLQQLASALEGRSPA